MADDDKKGPVKPPIIDAKPAEKPTVKPGAKPVAPASASVGANPSSPKPSSASKPTSPPRSASSTSKVEAKRSSNIGTIVIATLLGATLGAGTIGFMAYNNIVPFEKSASRSELSAAVETLQKRIFDLENAPAIDTSKFAQKQDLDGLVSAEQFEDFTAAQAELDDQLLALETTIAGLNDNSASIDISPDLENLKTELAALKSSIIELSPDNSTAVEQGLLQNERLEQTIAQIASIARGQNVNSDAIKALKSETETLVQSLATLSAKVEEEPAIIEQPATANLPLILNAWDSAIHSGTPYASYLSGAIEILPDLEPSEQALSNAATGVSTLSELSATFAQQIPLFVKDSADLPADAAWYDKLAAQAKSAIGLRPLDQSGDNPLALVARIEAALEAEDLSAAKSTFEQLPQNMKALAGDFGEKLNATFSAHQLFSEAQRMALELATSPQGTNQ
ncbi:COG4223 family protein [Maritalea sp.]|uniref:COG4223 family protein n=1 Tax=Maritalea sp. TaxID=2003361 RepID=UPI003EF580B1